MNNQKEVWKDVKHYEGIYQISSFGRVKSFRCNRVRFLNGSVNKNYTQVSLRDNNKVSSNKKIHILVAIAFHEHSPNGTMDLVVDHIDHNPLNNRADNLQLITNRENCSKDKKGGSSKYVGVCWHKKERKFISNIFMNGKNYRLGSFVNEIDASEAYKKALKDYTQSHP